MGVAVLAVGEGAFAATCVMFSGEVIHAQRQEVGTIVQALLTCLRTNLDCNTAIYCCCTDDACGHSCVADLLPES